MSEEIIRVITNNIGKARYIKNKDSAVVIQENSSADIC